MISKCLHNKSVGLLLIRVALGVAFITHGWMKINNIEMTHAFFMSIGLSSIVWTYLAAYGEFLGGLGLVLGLWTRKAGLVLTIIMIVAISFVHWKYGYNMEKGYEYQSVLLLGSLALAFTGAGKYALDARFMHKCDEHCQNGNHCNSCQ